MNDMRNSAVRAAIVELGFASADPPSWEQIEASAATAPALRRPARRLMVAVAVAVATVLLVGAPVWLLFRGPSSGESIYEGTLTSVTGTSAPSPTVSTSTVPATTVPGSGETTSTDVTSTTASPTPTATTLPSGAVAVRFDTEIVFGWDFSSNVWESATFRASGPAVESGLICDVGAMDLSSFDRGLGTWRSDVRYTCADGSGEFHLVFDLAGGYSAAGYTETGTWTLGSGSGAYADLVGSGSDDTSSPRADVYVSHQSGQVARTRQ